MCHLSSHFHGRGLLQLLEAPTDGRYSALAAVLGVRSQVSGVVQDLQSLAFDVEVTGHIKALQILVYFMVSRDERKGQYLLARA